MARDVLNEGMTLIEWAAKKGLHIMACDCESMHWVAMFKQGDDNKVGLHLFCTVCHTISDRLVPDTERGQKLLREVAGELETKEKERQAVEKDWGEMVNEQKALPPGEPKKGWKN